MCTPYGRKVVALNILVCFKVLPEWEQVLEQDWDGFTPDENLDYVKRVLNGYDESALEIALRLKDQLLERGAAAQFTALIVGAVPPPALCKTLFGAGVDELLVLKNPMLEFSSQWVAGVIAGHIKQNTYHVVLMGKQAGYAETGLVPPTVAEQLALPFISEVEQIAPSGDGIEVVHTVDVGCEKIIAALPVVLAVGNSPVSALRAVTLRRQLQVQGMQPQVMEVDCKSPAHPGFARISHTRSCRIYKAKHPLQLAEMLINGFHTGEAAL